MPRRNYLRKTARKKYQSKKYSNPFFHSKKHLPWKQMIVFGVCAALVIWGGLYLLGGARFEINAVEITGLETITNESVEAVTVEYLNKSAWLVFAHSNAILFDSEELKELFDLNFLFADVSISSQGRNIFISVHERTSNLIWQTEQGSYVVDLEGIIVREANESDMELDLPQFIDINNIDVTLGDSVLTEKEIEGVFLFHEHLQAQLISFYDTSLDRLAGKWVSVTTTDGFSILFDPTGNIDDQAVHLETVLREQIDNRSELDYIDLRFGDHVYYR